MTTDVTDRGSFLDLIHKFYHFFRNFYDNDKYVGCFVFNLFFFFLYFAESK